jgi:hypothetical protein
MLPFLLYTTVYIDVGLRLKLNERVATNDGDKRHD